MILNRIWLGMFLIAFIVASSKLFFLGDVEIFESLVNAMMGAAKTGFEIALYLTGIICLWMGIMNIGEKGGAVFLLTKAVSPLFTKLFPEVPKNHPAIGSMMMNFSANMLGLDNSATPLGLKAMKELQELNPKKDTATDAQIMFLVLNTSGLTIIPVTIFAYRSASESPTSVFIPILIATFIASLAGLIFVAIQQRINLLNKIVLAYIGTATLLISLLLYFVVQHPEYNEVISKVGGNFTIFLIVISFIVLAARKKVNVYNAFIDGAKDGFNVAVSIIPYLVAMLCAIAVFRASGTLDALLNGIKHLALYAGITATEWIDALPVAFMKPLSGSGARGAYLEIMSHFGVDSLQEKIAATFQGSTETTFYVLAVYFGAVRITNTRYAAIAGLFSDFVGIVSAIFISYLFYT